MKTNQIMKRNLANFTVEQRLPPLQVYAEILLDLLQS